MPKAIEVDPKLTSEMMSYNFIEKLRELIDIPIRMWVKDCTLKITKVDENRVWISCYNPEKKVYARATTFMSVLMFMVYTHYQFADSDTEGDFTRTLNMWSSILKVPGKGGPLYFLAIARHMKANNM